MMTADSLRFIVPSGVSIHWPSPRRCACSASADPTYRASHLALPSHVQTSCLERARPAALIVLVRAFACGLAASSTAPPGRRRPERQRRAKAEGKTKGGGTWRPAKSVCTWGLCGTMRFCRRAVRCMKPASTLRYRRASYDEARHPFLGRGYE